MRMCIRRVVLMSMLVPVCAAQVPDVEAQGNASIEYWKPELPLGHIELCTYRGDKRLRKDRSVCKGRGGCTRGPRVWNELRWHLR